MDFAFAFGFASDRPAVIARRAKVPLAVPTILIDGFLHGLCPLPVICRALFFFFHFANRRELMQNSVHEMPQPNRLAFPCRTDMAHSVIPVAFTDKRQSSLG